MSLQKKEKKRCVQKNGNVHLSQVLVIIYVVKHSTPASVQPPSARLSNNPIYTPPSALLHPTSTMGHTCYPNKDSCDWLIVLRKMISERNVRVLLSRRDRSYNRISHKTIAKHIGVSFPTALAATSPYDIVWGYGRKASQRPSPL